MKYLLVLAVVMVAFYVWRNNRLADRDQAARQKPPPARTNTPAIMVACQQCGTHLPQTEAVRGSQGHYCSAEHRRLREDGARARQDAIASLLTDAAFVEPRERLAAIGDRLIAAGLATVFFLIARIVRARQPIALAFAFTPMLLYWTLQQSLV